MGYFSNGTEGGLYFESYCSRCVHDTNEDCPIWAAHLRHNGTHEEAGKDILDALIPRTDGGLSNGQCVMFIARAADGDLFAEIAA